MKKALGPVALAAAALALLAAPAAADMALQKKAKDLKLATVQNCQSCHVDKMPKKGAATFNDMGKYLVDQKAAKKAKEVDVAWLKDYKPKAK
jgi:mono/diheme cytochrome c family protein